MNIYKYIIKGGLAQMKKNRKSLFRFRAMFLLLLGVMFLSVMPVTGVKAEEPLPEPTATPIMAFQLDGECTGDMVYVKLEGESTFQTLTELVTARKVHAEGNKYTVMATNTAWVYIKYDPAKQMLQGDITGTSEETATKVTQMKTYFIQVDPKFNTITWGYSEEIHGADAYLEHGRAEVIAIEGISDFHDIPFANNPGDDKGGHIAVDAKKKVTIKLIPDYGYQLAGVQLNGGLTIEPDKDKDKMYTFTFTMPDTNVHFKSIFTRVEDKTEINTQSQSISSATISNGANAEVGGNLQLTVTDSTGYDVAAAQQKVTGAVSAQAVELDLKQLVAKGNGDNWEKQITEFTNPITLSLGISNYDANYDYVVVRDHNGTTTALPTKVINGKVTFDTNKFSTYVIVKKEKSAAASAGSSNDDSNGKDDNSTDAQPVATQAVTQELDAVPKTGEGIGTYGLEIVLLFGGILLIYTGILLKRKRCK